VTRSISIRLSLSQINALDACLSRSASLLRRPKVSRAGFACEALLGALRQEEARNDAHEAYSDVASEEIDLREV
jgi:hypothetical protein